MKVIDLRSDTITKPSPEMRQAMANAEVGDDVYGEDPTINLLQNRIAKLLKKEAALFVPSGVMANQLAIKVNTQPGDEIIVERDSHIFNYETAAASFLSRIQLNTIQGTRGVLTLEQIKGAMRSKVYYNPSLTLVCLENTHNKAGGTIYPIEEIKRISKFARKQNIALHLDGARLWNAHVATKIPLYEYAKYFDTISVCFSKGLGAPVGSVLVSSKEKISLARKYRKIFGGGMRQAGILAAAALYAIEHNIPLLEKDHENAKEFAKELSTIPGFKIDFEGLATNIVMIDISQRNESTTQILAKMKKANVLLGEMSQTAIRAVTHLNVTRDEVLEAANRIKKIFS